MYAAACSICVVVYSALLYVATACWLSPFWEKFIGSPKLGWVIVILSVGRSIGRGWVAGLFLCFTQRFKEHRNAFKSGRNTSNYAKHALELSYSFGPIQERVQIIQYQAKGAHLNTVERYFIYKEFFNNSHLNDDSNIAPNKIFDALLKLQKP